MAINPTAILMQNRLSKSTKSEKVAFYHKVAPLSLTDAFNHKIYFPELN